MKPLTPNNPHDEQLDDLIAAALHGDLSPEERTQFNTRLQTDAAAQAAYLEAQAMHDLLEKNHKEAQPDAAFEQRMVSGVRRKIQSEAHRETAWESVLALWKGVRAVLSFRYLWVYSGVCSLFLVLAFGFLIYSGSQVKGVFTTITSQLAYASAGAPTEDFMKSYIPQAHNEAALANADASRNEDLRKVIRDKGVKYVETAQKGLTLAGYVDASATQQFAGKTRAFGTGDGVTVASNGGNASNDRDGFDYNEPATPTVPQGGTIRGTLFAPAPTDPAGGASSSPEQRKELADKGIRLPINAPATPANPSLVVTSTPPSPDLLSNLLGKKNRIVDQPKPAYPTVTTQNGQVTTADVIKEETDVLGSPLTKPTTAEEAQLLNQLKSDTAAPAAIDDRKLIRNAQLELEVKSFQAAMDQITALTKAAGGYVDTSNSEKGGNGKLHGTVVVKVLPQNLDAFLLKLRDVGQVQNQSVSTDDVTKDYFDTQARLANSQKMEVQLQDLLKRENGKVSDLLAVERELGRVRGEIEQMQGQLKLYDFQVQYATVTMTMSEKDLNQAAAYLLKEQDDFSLFATDVEATFQKARQSADDFKAQVLTANLNRNSGSDVSAELEVMVAPDQIEPFLAQVRGLGRVADFTRQTQRVAKDGGDSTQPADQTATEKDKVQVHLAIRSDDETRKQVALMVVAKAVDAALDQAKAAALANAGVEILNSSLNKTPQGQSTAQLSVRVPGKDYAALMDTFKTLGRTASLSIQRNDNSGPGANGDDAPVIVSLSLTDDDAPLQQTELSIAAKDVDQQSQQIKKSAAAAGVEVKASSFERSPDGTEVAQMTFRLPIAQYPAFLETVKALGKVESLTVHRDDRPDQTRTDDAAPAEIALQLHSERAFVPDDTGLFATLSHTFGAGAGTLFGTLEFVGMVIAFLVPWVFAIALVAWVGRRIYVWRKK